MVDTWPNTIRIEKETIESVFFTFVNRTQSGHRNARSGDRHLWKIRLQTPSLSRSEYQALVAFAVQQEGRFKTFEFVSTVFNQPLGSASGSPKVDGVVSAGSYQIATDGWPNSTLVLKAGDYIKFANHKKVYMVTSNATTNGSGQATLNIKPALVSALSDNESVVYSNIPFTVAFSKDPFEVATDINHYASFDIELEEVWNS